MFVFSDKLPKNKITLLHLQGFCFVAPKIRSVPYHLWAAICGKPMISCEIHTGTSFINQHQQTGLVITPNSPDELRKAMQHLLDHPKDVKDLVLTRNDGHKLFSTVRQPQRCMPSFILGFTTKDLVTSSNKPTHE